MATGPTFDARESTPGGNSPRPDDMLDVVAGLDRELNKLAAARAVALELAARASRERRKVDLQPSDRFSSALLDERSFRAEVAVLLNISERAAENLIGISHSLVTGLPATLSALGDGDISWRHATIMVDETAGLPSEDQQKLEERVLSRPDRLTPPKFARVLRKAREERNPETITQRQTAAREQRGMSIDDGRDGMSDIILHLDSTHAHAIFNRATAGARALNDPLDDRTLDNRRADIITHVLLAEVDGETFGVVPDEWDDLNFVHWYRGITADVAVTVPVLSLLGQAETPATLDGWVPINLRTARALAGTAKTFVRILTHPETGVVLSVGRRRYKVPKDLRRFLEIRDLTCRFPGCSIAATRSDMDHIVDWQFNGETRDINLASECPGHHTLKGNTAWTVTQAADGSGVLTWTTPSGRSYRTYPQSPFAA
jgi:hypothetical protein